MDVASVLVGKRSYPIVTYRRGTHNLSRELHHGRHHKLGWFDRFPRHPRFVEPGVRSACTNDRCHDASSKETSGSSTCVMHSSRFSETRLQVLDRLVGLVVLECGNSSLHSTNHKARFHSDCVKKQRRHSHCRSLGGCRQQCGSRPGAAAASSPVRPRHSHVQLEHAR